MNFLEDGIAEIAESLKKTIVSLIKIQTFVSVLCWYFSNEIVNFLYLPSLMEPIFRYGVIGAYLQILFLISNIILLYFEEKKAVLISYFTFLVCNGLFSWISILLGVRYYGLGYVLSSFVTLVISFYFLNNTIRDINFKTFMSQKMGRDNFATE